MTEELLLRDTLPAWQILLDGLTHAQVHDVESLLTPRQFAARTFLYREGELNDDLLLIQSGRACCSFAGIDGKAQICRIIAPNYVLGMVAMLTDSASDVSVQAIGKVSAMAMPKPAMMLLIEDIPRLAMNVGRLVAQMNRDSLNHNKRLLDPAPMRLGNALCSLALQDGRRSDDGSCVIRGVTQQDLAAMARVPRTWVAIMLSAFESKELIRRQPGVIEIENLHRFSAHIESMQLEQPDSSPDPENSQQLLEF